MLTASPNPYPPTSAGRGTTLLSWRAWGTDRVEVRVGGENGPIFVRSGPWGSKRTGDWLKDGTEFYLLDASGLDLPPLERILARLVVWADADREGTFAIVANYRTGTQYLVAGLRLSPFVRWPRPPYEGFAEVFAPDHRGGTFDEILRAATDSGTPPRLAGFKVIYEHLTPAEWRKLARVADLAVIHLTRRNKLRTVVSAAIATKTHQWLLLEGDETAADRTVEIDTGTIIEDLEMIEAGEKMTRELFSDRRVLEVAYEDLTADPAGEFSRVTRYLGIPPVDPGLIRFRKQNPEPMDRLVVNYDALRRMLLGTRFARYLDGDADR
jgi:hypothetical protein